MTVANQGGGGRRFGIFLNHILLDCVDVPEVDWERSQGHLQGVSLKQQEE